MQAHGVSLGTSAPSVALHGAIVEKKTTPSHSVSQNAKHNLGLSLLFLHWRKDKDMKSPQESSSPSTDLIEQRIPPAPLQCLVCRCCCPGYAFKQVTVMLSDAQFLSSILLHLRHANHNQNEMFMCRCFNRLFSSWRLMNQNELLS